MSYCNLIFQVIDETGQSYLGNIICDLISYSSHAYSKFEKNGSYREMMTNYIRVWLPDDETIKIHLIGHRDRRITDLDLKCDYVIDQANRKIIWRNVFVSYNAICAKTGIVSMKDYDDDEEIEEEEEDEMEIERGDEMEIERGDEMEIERGDEMEIERGDEMEIERGDEMEIERGDEMEIERGDEIEDKKDKVSQDFINEKYEDATKRISFWKRMIATEHHEAIENIYKMKLSTQLLRQWKWTSNNHLKIRKNYSFIDTDESSDDYDNTEIVYNLKTDSGNETGKFSIEHIHDRGAGQGYSTYYSGELDGMDDDEAIEMFKYILDETD